MTRLTCEMIENVPNSMELRDERLKHDLDIDMKGLSLLSLGLDGSDLNLNRFSVAAVPITSGKGVTEGFCQSVCAITRHLGMKSDVKKERTWPDSIRPWKAGRTSCSWPMIWSLWP